MQFKLYHLSTRSDVVVTFPSTQICFVQMVHHINKVMNPTDHILKLEMKVLKNCT